MLYCNWFHQVVGNTANALNYAFGSQSCFAIDYDFATHKCFFFGKNLVAVANNDGTNLRFLYLHCLGGTPAGIPAPSGTATSLNAVPNPSVIHITFCKRLNVPFNAAHGIYYLVIGRDI